MQIESLAQFYNAQVRAKIDAALQGIYIPVASQNFFAQEAKLATKAGYSSTSSAEFYKDLDSMLLGQLYDWICTIGPNRFTSVARDVNSNLLDEIDSFISSRNGLANIGRKAFLKEFNPAGERSYLRRADIYLVQLAFLEIAATPAATGYLMEPSTPYYLHRIFENPGKRHSLKKMEKEIAAELRWIVPEQMHHLFENMKQYLKLRSRPGPDGTMSTGKYRLPEYCQYSFIRQTGLEGHLDVLFKEPQTQKQIFESICESQKIIGDSIFSLNVSSEDLIRHSPFRIDTESQEQLMGGLRHYANAELLSSFRASKGSFAKPTPATRFLKMRTQLKSGQLHIIHNHHEVAYNITSRAHDYSYALPLALILLERFYQGSIRLAKQ